MKNRTLEICTSGSVRDEAGQPPSPTRPLQILTPGSGRRAEKPSALARKEPQIVWRSAASGAADHHIAAFADLGLV